MLKKLIVVLSLISSLQAQEFQGTVNQPWGESYWDDIKLGFFELPWEGFKSQFTAKNNLYYAGAAVPALWYSFEEDDRLSALGRSKDTPGFVKTVGDLGVLFNFPVIPVAFYAWGLKSGNNHHTQFAAEYAAALYLALVESSVLSFIDIHERPDSSGLNFFETSFRGDSSFPSGHVMPYAVLTFKTLQFYGPWWALAPAGLTVVASMQRVYDGRHFVSDVVGGVFLAAFASEGVRKAAKYSESSIAYRWLLDHDVQLGVIRHRGALGPRVGWSY